MGQDQLQAALDGPTFDRRPVLEARPEAAQVAGDLGLLLRVDRHLDVGRQPGVPGAAEAAFRVEKANLKVNMPSSIKGDYEMAIANFGTPLYGATLA